MNEIIGYILIIGGSMALGHYASRWWFVREFNKKSDKFWGATNNEKWRAINKCEGAAKGKRTITPEKKVEINIMAGMAAQRKVFERVYGWKL